MRISISVVSTSNEGESDYSKQTKKKSLGTKLVIHSLFPYIGRILK